MKRIGAIAVAFIVLFAASVYLLNVAARSSGPCDDSGDKVDAPSVVSAEEQSVLDLIRDRERRHIVVTPHISRVVVSKRTAKLYYDASAFDLTDHGLAPAWQETYQRFHPDRTNFCLNLTYVNPEGVAVHQDCCTMPM